MAANMYRVGDYVYFETSPSAPYQIRRIEELLKTPSGSVEAKVMCFYRRRDISSNLISLADKHQSAVEEQEKIKDAFNAKEREKPCAELNKDVLGSKELTALKDVVVAFPKTFASLSDKDRHQLKHRELFLSRQVETLPATAIRGKCQVTLLNETETLVSYLHKDDAFFYSLVYDPSQKTLLADKGEIRVGSKYQAEIPAWVPPMSRPPSPVGVASRETLVYSPHNQLDDRTIDQFLIICRSVGTFARALDCSSSVKQPSLHMSAAAASRDVTLFHAMQTLHRHNYDVSRALCSLVPSGGPVLCRDEMEEWSASEANLFEEALEKYGKDFNDIRADFLPWKSLKAIVEYYYMWKTTDRYVQQKRVKAVEAEFKLKQVYIPNYNKNDVGLAAPVVSGGSVARPCESCYTASASQWFAWGPAHMQCRLCGTCWPYWKKYGGLRYPTRVEAVGSVDLSATSSSSVAVASLPPTTVSVASSNAVSSHSTTSMTASGAAAATVTAALGSAGASPAVASITSHSNSGRQPASAAAAALANLSAAAAGAIGGVSGGPALSAAANLALVQQLATMKDGPARCPACGKESKAKAQLVRHCITHHGLNMSLPTAAAGVAVVAATSQGVPLSLMRSASPRPIVKTRAAFYLHTTPQTKQLRRQCRGIIKPRHAARNPFSAVDLPAIRIEMQTKPLTGVVPKQMKNRGRVIDISHRLGTPATPRPDFLLGMPPSRTVPSLSDTFVRKGSLKRPAPYDEQPTSKRSSQQVLDVGRMVPTNTSTSTKTVVDLANTIGSASRSSSVHGTSNPAATGATTSNKPTRKHMGSWCSPGGQGHEAPDDVFFKASQIIKRLRKAKLNAQHIRRFARRATRYVFNMHKL